MSREIISKYVFLRKGPVVGQHYIYGMNLRIAWALAFLNIAVVNENLHLFREAMVCPKHELRFAKMIDFFLDCSSLRAC